MRPHSNRLRSRSSNVAIERGWRSEDSTICLLASYSELKVWKNSSWSPSLFSMNWMSSTSSTSHARYRRLKAGRVLVRMPSTNSFMNVSVDT